ncbi:hypothetical protein CL176_02155 [Suicoccus acidiformans]|uniref:Uncharacterized protein n=1 Tax=Suicoccus acidiformans TaxID=2036206 RepID=A0A347WIL4_9LACT|nr:hypothetical protein [Suicoccus acidiformans]AXY24921.1 hypothetical protein CL176_02155 [Suicoccus acidiformans]
MTRIDMQASAAVAHGFSRIPEDICEWHALDDSQNVWQSDCGQIWGISATEVFHSKFKGCPQCKRDVELYLREEKGA